MKKFKNYMKSVQNIISFSGGKDSTAIYLLALKWGLPFRPVFADTGHEHEWTLEFIKELPGRVGGPAIEIIRADFTKRFEKRRKTVLEKWPQDGVPQDVIDRTLELLHPTGVPFLDLCMLKGRFPSTKARFCTEELKSLPMMFQVLLPALKAGPVVGWQGVRAQESRSRAMMAKIEWGEARSVIYRPIFNWTHEQVFNIHAQMGVEPNPLYKVGMGRVGCMPCIMCQKSEISVMAKRFPEHVERIAAWENLVASVSKRGVSTFFAADTAVYPEGYDPERDGYYKIHDVVAWSNTDRGGRQFNLLNELEEPLCSSKYGLCE